MLKSKTEKFLFILGVILACSWITFRIGVLILIIIFLDYMQQQKQT